MTEITIETPDDPRLAEYRNLLEHELVKSAGAFIAEGRLVVQRLIDDGRHRVRSVLVNDAARRELRSSLARLEPEVPVYIAAADWFQAITGFNIHRGCLALADRPAQRSPVEVVSTVDLAVVLEDLGNPDNVGGVFRNAAAFGAGAVLLNPGCCDPLYRKAIRTSMAATLRVPFARVEHWPGGLADLAACGFALVALTPRDGAMTLDEFASRTRPGRLALLVGSEGAGLTSAAMASAAHRVRIPISPSIDSLNVAVASGIALSRLSRLTDLAHLE
jgi:tRNA G18 (ribose-2'-O)-methylase SpoU